jgi:hypothetical protein
MVAKIRLFLLVRLLYQALGNGFGRQAPGFQHE